MVRVDGLVWSEVDGEVIVLDTATATYHSVQGAGLVLWPMLVEGTTPAALAGALRDRFGIDERSATTDVTTFLEECSSLITVS